MPESTHLDRLTPAVVTSCFAAPLSEVLFRLAQQEIRNIDLYVDESHLGIVKRRYGHLRVSAFERWVKEETGAASEKFGQPIEPKFVAISTGFIGLSARDSRERELAIEGLRGLLGFAESRGCRAIEVRGGLRLVRVPYKPKNNRGIRGVKHAVLNCEVEALGNFCSSLCDVFAPFGTELPPVGLAIELEPGLPYLMQNYASLDNLCKHLNSFPPPYRERIGLNLDIGHCLLGTLDGEGFRRAETELGLHVFHCHCSDHTRQHADRPPGSFHCLDREFSEWISYYWERIQANRDPARARFLTGTVSVELEAAEYIHEVVRAYNSVKYLCTKH